MHNPLILERIAQENRSDNSNSNEDFVNKAAELLKYTMLENWQEIVIKKYGLIPEANLQKVFKKVEEQTRDKETPVVYINLDKEAMELSMQEDSTDFYKGLVKSLIDSLKETRFSTKDAFKKIQELYETDFNQLYSDYHENYKGIMRSSLHIGPNLGNLINAISESEQKYSKPHLLINISNLPNLPEGSVSVSEETKDSIIKPSGTGFEKAASYASSTMHTFFVVNNDFDVINSRFVDKRFGKTIAIPGWTIDVLSHSWGPTQKWNNHAFFNEGVIHQELRYRQIINL